MTFWMYILQSEATQKFYIGSTGNLEDRLKRHNSGRSKYTKSGKPWRLVYCEEFESRSDAVVLENKIKSWKSRIKIEELINRI